MTERIRFQQAADFFANREEERARRSIPSNFSETAARLNKKQNPNGRFVRQGLPIRSRFKPFPESQDETASSQPLKPDFPIRKMDPLAHLTPSQREVAELIVEGLTTAQIAQKLNKRPATIRVTRSKMATNLGISPRELAATLEKFNSQG